MLGLYDRYLSLSVALCVSCPPWGTQVKSSRRTHRMTEVSAARGSSPLLPLLPPTAYQGRRVRSLSQTNISPVHPQPLDSIATPSSCLHAPLHPTGTLAIPESPELAPLPTPAGSPPPALSQHDQHDHIPLPGLSLGAQEALNVLVHACNSSTWEMRTAESLGVILEFQVILGTIENLRPAYAT